jgi:hypothetical protein
MEAHYEFTTRECKFIIGVNTLSKRTDPAQQERDPSTPSRVSIGGGANLPGHRPVTSPKHYASIETRVLLL